MRTIRFISALSAFALLFLLVSCSEYSEKTDASYGTGYYIDPEEISKIKEECLDEPKEPFVIDENTEYYWTEGGTKYHIFKDCQALSRTDQEDILIGDIKAARHAGKEALCSFCLKKGNLEEDTFEK